MSLPTELIIGTRGSELALWQANHVRDLLLENYPSLIVDIMTIKTTGDNKLDSPISDLGGKGAFTKELEECLLVGEIDIAVHSLKDIPTSLPSGLQISAILKRGAIEDVFLSNDPGVNLFELQEGATIATGSLRRRSQILTKRPDYNVIDLRGNVPTRIRKLRESNWSGIVLALAGLQRLGFTDDITHTIPVEQLLPAPGQGAIAIESCTEKSAITSLLKVIHDSTTSTCVTVERMVLEGLGGGCTLPLGTYARYIDDSFHVDACYYPYDNYRGCVASLSSNTVDPEVMAKEVIKNIHFQMTQ